MVTDGTVTADGHRIHYCEAGAGHSVVLLHGGIIDAARVSWPPVIERLATDYHVVAPDLLGYGESDLPPGPYSIQRHAEVIADGIDALDLGPVTLVGLSMGGGVAMQVALDHPDRLDGLVPIDAFGLGRELPNGRLSYALARVQLFNRLAVAAFRRSRRLTRASLAGLVHDLDSLPPAAVDAVYREVQRPTAGAAFRRFRDSEVTRQGYRTTFTDRFEDFSMPVHFLHGAHDGLFPLGWARRAAAAVPDGELTVLDDCAHWAPREDPDAVSDLVSGAISAV